MSLANEIKDRFIYDQKAETTTEIAESCGETVKWVQEYAREQLKLKKWEKVWKRVDGRRVAAYRRRSK